jgi:hypothetical protein
MNRFILTSAMALTALVLGQQRASAWCEFKMGGCFNISYKCGGHCWYIGCRSDPYPGPTCATPYSVAGSNYQAPPVQKPLPTGPAPTPVQKSGYEGWNYSGYQAAGYYNYPQAGYGFYQAPSYWYGR